LVAIHQGAAAIAKAPAPILTLEALALPLKAVWPTGGTTDRGIAHSIEAITAAEPAAGASVAPGEIAASTEAGAGPTAPASTPLHASTTATATATASTAATATTTAATTGLEGGLVLFNRGGRAHGQKRSGGHGHEGSRQEAERGTEWVCHHLTPFRWATRSQPPS
jgi:hypothetical protein